MSRPGNLLPIRLVSDGDIAHGIEEIDRDVQFFLKEFAHVRHAQTASTQINSRRRFALLLRSIMTDRPHDFSMQPGHRAPNNFRHPRHIRVRGIGISTPEADEAALSFARFGSGKGLVEFPRQRCRHRTATDRDAA